MTREEMIQTVSRITRSYNVCTTNDKMMSVEIVDALYPRQRSSVPLPDGGRMEWHGKEHSSWRRFNNLGELRESYVYLTTHGLDDDLHAECFALKGREWVEDERHEALERIDYAIHLQRIIEALCHGYDIPATCEQGAPHHFNMATRFKASTPAPTNESFTEVAVGEFAPTKDDVNALAELMLATWKRVDPKSSVALYPASYVANFADMARDLLKVYPFKAAPTNATPLGFANVYSDFQAIAATEEEAKNNASPACKETAVPVYRHAQTEAELIAALEGCGYMHSTCFVRTIADPKHDRLRHQFTKRAGGGK